MAKKVVIAASATLQDEIQKWRSFWKEKGYLIIDYPKPIQDNIFLQAYPQAHKEFFENIIKADILFVMNEDKKGITGYLGAESFAEMAFGVAQKLVYNRDIEVILLKQPSEKVQSYEEINLWLKLGWIKIFNT